MKIKDIENSLEREALRHKGKAYTNEVFISIGFLAVLTGLSTAYLYECSYYILEEDSVLVSEYGDDGGLGCSIQGIDVSDTKKNITICNVSLITGILNHSVLFLKPISLIIIDFLEKLDGKWSRENQD